MTRFASFRLKDGETVVAPFVHVIAYTVPKLNWKSVVFLRVRENTRSGSSNKRNHGMIPTVVMTASAAHHVTFHLADFVRKRY